MEPGWEGHVTLEFSNTTPLPAKIYANEGVAQFIFLKGNENPEVTYSDRKGTRATQRKDKVSTTVKSKRSKLP